jgi:hypothetical protein
MNDWNTIYAKKWFDMIGFCLLVIGGLVLGLDGIVAKKLNIYLRILFILIGFVALIKMFSRDYYLPFLGESAFPCGFLLSKSPELANREVHVYAPPFSTIIYWAAESDKEVKANPILAYAKNLNAGVTTSDESGRAILKIREPAGYYVAGGMKKLSPHVHYRICKTGGMLGRIETVFL